MLWWHFFNLQHLSLILTHSYSLAHLVLLMSEFVRMQVWRKPRSPAWLPWEVQSVSPLHLELEVQMWCVSCRCLHLSLPQGLYLQSWLCDELYGFTYFTVTFGGELSEGRPPEQTVVYSALYCRGKRSLLMWREWQDAGCRMAQRACEMAKLYSVLSPPAFVTRVSDITIYWWLGHRKANMDGCWSIDHLKKSQLLPYSPLFILYKSEIIDQTVSKKQFYYGFE